MCALIRFPHNSDRTLPSPIPHLIKGDRTPIRSPSSPDLWHSISENLTKQHMKEGSKYQPLLDYLRENRHLDEVTLNFAEIEALLNGALPPSALRQQAWWSNRKKGALQATAWMEAGYRVETVDLDSQRVTFRKLIQKIQVRHAGDRVQWNGELIKALRLHMGLTQAEFAEQIGVRQATVSDWEQSIHAPNRAISRYLSIVAEQAGFNTGEKI